MRPETIGAAAVAGLATGPRSFTGLAAVVLVARRDSQSQPDRVLGHPVVKSAVGLIALQEWVMDKLPSTPSRLEWLGLATRATGAGAAGAILARRGQIADASVASIAPDSSLAERPPGEPEEAADPPAPDLTAIAACTATAAAIAVAVAFIGVQLRGFFDHLTGRDWPGAALEDASSAILAAAAVYISTPQ